MPILSPRPPSPRRRGVCVRCSQPPGNDTARVWLSQPGVWSARLEDPWTAEGVPRNGDGSHGNPGLLSHRSRSVLRERWLICSDLVRGFRPGHFPLWVPDITARFHRRGMHTEGRFEGPRLRSVLPAANRNPAADFSKPLDKGMQRSCSDKASQNLLQQSRNFVPIEESRYLITPPFSGQWKHEGRVREGVEAGPEAGAAA
jgi:hypothetical protein